MVDYGNKDIKEIEILWYVVILFYVDMFVWLEGKVDKFDIENVVIFYFVMFFYFIEDSDIDVFKENMW